MFWCSFADPVLTLLHPCLVADGDPHFVVEFPLSKLTVCFNINGEPGHVLRLVSDHKHSGEPEVWWVPPHEEHLHFWPTSSGFYREEPTDSCSRHVKLGSIDLNVMARMLRPPPWEGSGSSPNHEPSVWRLLSLLVWDFCFPQSTNILLGLIGDCKSSSGRLWLSLLVWPVMDCSLSRVYPASALQ